MGEFHRTYSKVWWPNLELEDSLSPSSSPSSNGSHRSQDSGFSDTSTSKQSAEQHLRNFAHTPENQNYSSPEPSENIAEEIEEHEDIILPESQYSETPIRVRKPSTKAQGKDKRRDSNDRNKASNSCPPQSNQVPRSGQDQNTTKLLNQNLNCSEPSMRDQNCKPKTLIDSEKISYLRKKDNRKSLGCLKNSDKKSSELGKKNRLSLSLNLVTHQNEENVNPRLYQSHSEQPKQPNQSQNSSSTQSRPNNFFKETCNFQPYRTDKNQKPTPPKVIDSDSCNASYIQSSPSYSHVTNGHLPHSTSPQSGSHGVYHNSYYARPEIQDSMSPVRRSNESKNIENKNQSTMQRNSLLLQNLNPAERQLLENLTANYLSQSNSLEKDESIYENLEKNLACKIMRDKVQKGGNSNLKETCDNRNSVSLNLTSTAFNETIHPLNHSVDSHNYSATEIFEPRNNLHRYHTYTQICEQDSNCFIKKWENSMADSSANQSNNSSMHESHDFKYDASQSTSQITQDSMNSDRSSNQTGASYYLQDNSNYSIAHCSAAQKNLTHSLENSSRLVMHGSCQSKPNYQRDLSTPNCTQVYSSQQNDSHTRGLPVLSTVNFSHHSSLENSMLSESINSVLSRQRSKSNELLDRLEDSKSQNSSFSESVTEKIDQRTYNPRAQPQVEQSTRESMNQAPYQTNPSSHLNNAELLNLKVRRRSQVTSDRAKRSRSLARINRHSANLEIQEQEHLNKVRRCKSLNNLESQEVISSKVEHNEKPVLCGGKSFLQSNLDLIEPPHFTSTPKKLPRPLQLQKRKCPVPPVISQRREEEQNTSRTTDPPVSHWLRELSQRYDAEYMTALQSKALVSERLGESQILSGPASQYIVILQEKIRTISNEFTKLLRQIDSSKWELIGPLSQSLLGHIEQFLEAYQVASPLMRSEIEALRSEAFREPPLGDKLKVKISSLGKSFASVVDTILFDQIHQLLSSLETDRTPSTVLSTLSSLSKLGLDAAHLGNLVARYPGGVRVIVRVCLDVPCLHVTICALRTITLLCSSVQCIRQLEKCNGIEILADILSDETRDEDVLSEAISVLAQVTAPWLDTNQSVADLHCHVDTFVAALTRLMRKQLNSETLLLISAALANLSFMEPKAVWSMQKHNSIGILLTAVRKLATRASVFLQEQTATLIANMAAIPEARPSLAQARAVVALLCFLQTRASPLQRAPEIMAAERLQHKSAIALSRLCSDVHIAQQVVELQGVNRLVKLCKEERERNHSDGVLVACLAALRKITTNCGTDKVEELNAIELVEPNLLDSFMLYSSKQESYV